MNVIKDIMIILVDPDTIFVKKVKTLLIKEGFKNVVTAPDCASVIEICKSYTIPILVVMEFTFEKMTGEMFMEEIKHYKNDVQFIVLSGSKKLSDSFKCIRGGVPFIHKSEKKWEEMIIDVVQSSIELYITRERLRIHINKIKTFQYA